MRFVVLGEGIDEHGRCGKGPDLMPLREGSFQGSIVTLVRRLLRERHGIHAIPLCWTPVDRRHQGRPGPPPSAGEILSDENLLPRFLEKLLCPVARNANQRAEADFVVLSCDLELEDRFLRAVARVRAELRSRVISIVFDPELEVLFVQSKRPLEAMYGLRNCSTLPPTRLGDLKQSLQAWIRSYAPNARLDGEFRERVARELSFEELSGVPSWQTLEESLGRIVRP